MNSELSDRQQLGHEVSRMGEGLSPQCLRLLTLIIQGAAKGCVPSYRQLTAVMGYWSLGALQKPLAKLRKAGLVTWEDDSYRSLRPACRLYVFEEALNKAVQP